MIDYAPPPATHIHISPEKRYKDYKKKHLQEEENSTKYCRIFKFILFIDFMSKIGIVPDHFRCLLVLKTGSHVCVCVVPRGMIKGSKGWGQRLEKAVS